MDSAGFGKCYDLACLGISFTLWWPRPNGSDFRAWESYCGQPPKAKLNHQNSQIQNESLLRKGRLLGLITRPEYIVEWEKLYDLIQGPVEGPSMPLRK